VHRFDIELDFKLLNPKDVNMYVNKRRKGISLKVFIWLRKILNMFKMNINKVLKIPIMDGLPEGECLIKVSAKLILYRTDLSGKMLI